MATFEDLTAPDTVQDLRNQTSPLLVNAFELYIPNMPGGGDSASLRLRLLSCDNPIQMEISVVDLHTKRFYYRFAGALKPKQEISVVFQESANGTITASLQKWLSKTVSFSTGYNYSADSYKTTAFLYLIGVNQKYCAEVVMRNFWMSSYEMAALAEDREKNDIMDVTCKFVFDYVDFPVSFVVTE